MRTSTCRCAGRHVSPYAYVLWRGRCGQDTFREKLRDTFEVELPCAFLDFRRDDGGSLTADDLPSVLFEVTRQLDVICPHFELAYIRFGELRNQAAVKPGAKNSSLVTDLAETTVSEAISEVVFEKLPFGAGALVKGARAGIEYLSAPARVKAWRELLKTADGKRLRTWLETADLDKIHRKLKDLLIQQFPASPR
jgi:hypothetical protein